MSVSRPFDGPPNGEYLTLSPADSRVLAQVLIDAERPHAVVKKVFGHCPGREFCVVCWTEDCTKASDELEQARVQLAGCSVAALGWNHKPAMRGDYGWSQAYQDVLELRRDYDKLRARTAVYFTPELLALLRRQFNMPAKVKRQSWAGVLADLQAKGYGAPVLTKAALIEGCIKLSPRRAPQATALTAEDIRETAAGLGWKRERQVRETVDTWAEVSLRRAVALGVVIGLVVCLAVAFGL